jgi:hypothetical protein
MIASRQRSRRPLVAARRSPPSGRASTSAVIAYDSGATFRLEGKPGRIIEDVINISPEGVFVAVAIGYGFEEERGRALALQPSPDGRLLPPLPGDLTLGNIPASALIEGFRVNSRFEHLVFRTPGNGDEADRRPVRDRVLADEAVPTNLLTDDRHPTLLERVKTPEEISFFFSVIDTSTGREFQDEPTHNLASLGKSNGERPFRLLAQPITFAPRSTVRLQVIERTEGVTGTLFIVLYGYKVLGASVCPETVGRSLTGPWQCPVETIGRPSDRIIPFDYVVTIPLSGRPRNLVENETIVSAEGGFVATAVGYGLLVEEQAVSIQSGTKPGTISVSIEEEPGGAAVTGARVKVASVVLSETPPGSGTYSSQVSPGAYDISVTPSGVSAPLTAPSRIRVLGSITTEVKAILTGGVPPTLSLVSQTINLGSVPLRLLQPSALTDGIRIRPDLVRLMFDTNAPLNTRLPIQFLGELFERLNRVEDVSFRYTILDTGRGRELQNQPLHNVAGLGIANGDRPFKRLARPMVFLPRSTIRIQVEERFGRGTLFFVFQGYKILNPAIVGGRT